ncbi:fumarate hydratase [Jiulongibacter sediminis]|uniref:fumarate hydratase n=1 Tax=Jiulongibacter sediminis TaxID=1605367 RepID=UPI0026EAF5EA|nr:fumarate hydratase [Jiulongibacter sediminis]
MLTAAISGDIVAYTSLNQEGRQQLESQVRHLFSDLEKAFSAYCRLIKGDYIECISEKPELGLRLGLLLKTGLKATEIDIDKYTEDSTRSKYLKEIGLRISIGVGNLDEFDRETGRVDGEAIFLSGREIANQKTFNKDRIVIKNSLFFVSENEKWENQMSPVIDLIDVLLNKATGKQCQVVYFKLLGMSEKEISKKLGVAQSVVNQHSTSVGWNAIEKAVIYFENLIQ